MANLILACWRENGDALDAIALRMVADRITPDSQRHPPTLAGGPTEWLCLTGPSDSERINHLSAYVGAFADTPRDWAIPGGQIPDGTFALIRMDEGLVELCSDFAGSRTLWYARTDNYFFASTSQRALVCLLRDFDVSRAAISWFLSSGTLGPSDSWDTRISRMPPNARLVLDRLDWRLNLQTSPIVFHPRTMKRAECMEELACVLRSSIQSHGLDSDGWILPLSGGADSRCILMMMREKGWSPRTVTWGLAASLEQRGNDAYIARRLAAHYGLHHEYLCTESAEDPPVQVVDRFLSSSGGTTDQLPGYLDGLRIWSAFSKRGVKGVIRGDAGFNGEHAYSMQQARTTSRLVLLSDFMDEGLAEDISMGQQKLPEALKPTMHESYACYRDRIYHAFAVPVDLAALNDVKAPFVEIASPLLSRRVMEFIREMPDAFRAGRCLYEDLILSMGPSIPFATMDADDNSEDYLDSNRYIRWLEDELSSDLAMRLFPTAFLSVLLADLHGGAAPLRTPRTVRAAVKRIIPSPWIRGVRARMGKLAEIPRLRQLALRAALICRTIRMLDADALILGRDLA